jgi:hypothetical protein
MNPKAPRTIAKKTITEEEKIVLKKIGDKLKELRKDAGYTSY